MEARDIISIVSVVLVLGGGTFFGINNQHLKMELKEWKQEANMLRDSIQVIRKEKIKIDQQVTDLQELYEKSQDEEINIDLVTSDSALIKWFNTRFPDHD